MKFLKFAPISMLNILILLLGCGNAWSLSIDDDKGFLKKDSSICLDYSFNNKMPTSFKITTNHIFVGDGEQIYKFSKTGKFINTIQLPTGLEGFVKFSVLLIEEEFNFYTIWNGILTHFKSDGEILNQIECGDIIEVNKMGKVYTHIQEYVVSLGELIDRIKVINPDGTIDNLNNNIDFSTLNIVSVDSEIMLHTADNMFYIIEDESNSVVFKKIIAPSNLEVWFLGKIDSFFVFKTYNDTYKTDELFFYDDNFILVKTKLIKPSISPLINDKRIEDDFYFENPSGLIYSYHNSEIFYMLNSGENLHVYKIH